MFFLRSNIFQCLEFSEGPAFYVFVCNQDNERQLQLEEVSSKQETRLLAAAHFPMERKRETIITTLL